jgi:hypothetical protein
MNGLLFVEGIPRRALHATGTNKVVVIPVVSMKTKTTIQIEMTLHTVRGWMDVSPCLPFAYNLLVMLVLGSRKDSGGFLWNWFGSSLRDGISKNFVETGRGRGSE